MREIFPKIYGLEKGIDEGIKTYKNIVYRKDDEDLRNERVYIRLTKDEKEMLKNLARIRHQNVSDFVRLVIFDTYLNEFIKITS